MAQHFFFRAEGGAGTVIEHEERVAFLNGGGAVGHDEHGAPFALHRADRGIQGLAAFIVEVGVGFVEDEDLRIAIHGARQTDALHLPAREPAAIGGTRVS